MEYVAGVSITEYCDRNRLDIPDRLRLFAQACEAIQHAHQKGIIHRDIKLATTRFCETDPPFQPQVKFIGLYPLPWYGLIVSGTFQSLPGISVEANMNVRGSDIAPSLGRPFSGGPTATVSVPLIQPFTMFADRLNRFDFRATRRFLLTGNHRFEVQFDLYNLLNSNPVTALNSTYGTAWLRPINILPGRLAKFGVQWEF